MLLSLLLQKIISVETTSLTNVYIALGGTIAASALAAWTSFRASNKSARTAREVAALSAQTAQESARLAAETARELKERDYKNDFYKKLIEKRLNAWAEAEEFTRSMARVTRDISDGGHRFRYFANTDKFWKLIESLNATVTTHAIWLGGEYAQHSITFRQRLLDIANECSLDGKYLEDSIVALDGKKLWEAGKKHHQELGQLYFSMVTVLRKQLASLHDIESFLTGS